MSEKKEYDLRSALELIRSMPGHYLETDYPVRPADELSGVYRHIGAGGTVMRPTKLGPALIFNHVEGYPDWRVLIGLFADRRRAAAILGTKPSELSRHIDRALSNQIAPIVVPASEAKCREVVHRADDPDFDLRKILPAPTNTPEDAGPYITLGLVYGKDLETQAEDVTIHRMCVQNKDEISIYFVKGRHLDEFRKKYEAADKPMPITVSIGLDPAIYITACFEPPTTPIGLNELGVAGGLRGEPVEMVKALTVDALGIANAEVVIEGEILPGKRMREDVNSNTGRAMPEFPGYTGPAAAELPIIKVKAVTHRVNPIMQTCIGPSEEHVVLAGLPTEASIQRLCDKAMPGKLLNVHAARCGGGKYVAVLQYKKTDPSDEGRHRQAALTAFAAYPELKTVFIVDEDVDPFDMDEVLWAMTTRYQADVDTIIIPGVRCHPLDPSQDPSISPSIRTKGATCKTIFDCTAPFDQKTRFRRSHFLDVDPTPWLEASHN